MGGLVGCRADRDVSAKINIRWTYRRSNHAPILSRSVIALRLPYRTLITLQTHNIFAETIFR